MSSPSFVPAGEAPEGTTSTYENPDLSMYNATLATAIVCTVVVDSVFLLHLYIKLLVKRTRFQLEDCMFPLFFGLGDRSRISLLYCFLKEEEIVYSRVLTICFFDTFRVLRPCLGTLGAALVSAFISYVRSDRLPYLLTDPHRGLDHKFYRR